MKRLCLVGMLTVAFTVWALSVTAQDSGPRGRRIWIQSPGGGDPIDLYDGSYALVVGNSHYNGGWDNLRHAAEDAVDVARALEQQGFEVDLEKDLSAAEFKNVFLSFFNRYGGHSKNRLLFYYAGHGHAEDSPNEPDKKIGYLIMTDTPAPDSDRVGFKLNSIGLDWIERESETVSAHHVLFMFDSCFSGAIFEAMRGTPIFPAYISDSTHHRVRQFISAGRSGETVPDRSVFKKVFLDLLGGKYPEAVSDGYLTGSEIGHYLYREVVNGTRNRQHPQYGKSRSLELNKGDFVFVMDKPPETAAGACWDITVKHPPKFPHALKNTIPTEDYPYWLFVKVNNQCPQDILFDLSFDLVDGPAVINNPDKRLPYTVKQGATLADTVPLPISFPKPDIDDILIITWTIQRSDDKTRMKQGISRIQILPKQKYCWNLLRHDNQPVSRDFLLASLTAWSQAADGELKKIALDIIGKTRGAKHGAGAWMDHCYHLFQGAGPIEVPPFSTQKPFPPRECWDIYTPMEVMRAKLGDPLEASLLIGALAKKGRAYKRFGMRLQLLIVPKPGSHSQPQDFYLSWITSDGTRGALDMTLANNISFDENRTHATRKVADLLKDDREIGSSLDGNGVYMDVEKGFFALDFQRAADRYKIRALP